MSAFPLLTKCPRCQQEQAKIVGYQRAVCDLCSGALRRVYQFCWACRREWQKENCSNSCDLPGCALRGALLSDAVFTDPVSSVLGCPLFRACPTCKGLLTHSGEGCPFVECQICQTGFCFRCLRKECGGYASFDDEFDEDDEVNDGHQIDVNDEGEYVGFCDDYDKQCTVAENSKTLEAFGF